MRTRIVAILLLPLGFLGGLLFDYLTEPHNLLAGQEAPYREVVAAREFRLVDQNGRTRCSLKLDKQDEFILSLYEPDGSLRGSFGLTAEGRPSITLGTGKK